jgi:thiamine kinase-like enzyme
MKKINTALSNEVYMDENYVYKHIVVNPFKEIMCKNEIAVINAYDSDLRVIESTDKEIKLNIVDGITKERYTDDEIIRIADEIKRFHQTNIDNKELTPFQEAYEFLGGKKDISKALEILSKDPVLLHNDLVEGNILISEDKVRLIDFEYS